jgi:hypothetical protein
MAIRTRRLISPASYAPSLAARTVPALPAAVGRASSGLARLALALLVTLTAACSAPDPGEIPYRAPPKGPRPSTGTPIVAAGDAGSDDGAVFQTPFAPGTAKLSSTQPKHAERAELQNQTNPAGHSCVNECHSAGGVAVQADPAAAFTAGGTVYADQTGAATAGAGVEVRIRNPDGTAVSAFTDENGNFFVRQSEFTIQQGASSGIRNSDLPMLMVSTLASGALGGACANGNGCHAKGGLGGVLRVKN